MMRPTTTSTLALTLATPAGCAAWNKTPICCDGGYEYRHRSQWEDTRRPPTWPPASRRWNRNGNGWPTS